MNMSKKCYSTTFIVVLINFLFSFDWSRASVLTSNDGSQVVVRPYQFGLFQQQQQQQQQQDAVGSAAVNPAVYLSAGDRQTVHGVDASGYSSYVVSDDNGGGIVYNPVDSTNFAAAAAAASQPAVANNNNNYNNADDQPQIVASADQLKDLYDKSASAQQLQSGDYRPLAEFERAGYGYRRKHKSNKNKYAVVPHHHHVYPAPAPQTYQQPQPQPQQQQQQQQPSVYIVPLYQPASSYPAPHQQQQTYRPPAQPAYQQPQQQSYQPPQPSYQPPPQPQYKPVQPQIYAPPPHQPVYRPPPQPVYVSPPHYHVHVPMPSYQPVQTYDVETCPLVAENFCYGKEAGHYGHPGTKECFVQCDHVGRAFAKECAYGTSWRGYGTEAAYANMCA